MSHPRLIFVSLLATTGCTVSIDDSDGVREPYHTFSIVAVEDDQSDVACTGTLVSPTTVVVSRACNERAIRNLDAVWIAEDGWERGPFVVAGVAPRTSTMDMAVVSLRDPIEEMPPARVLGYDDFIDLAPTRPHFTYVKSDGGPLVVGTVELLDGDAGRFVTEDVGESDAHAFLEVDGIWHLAGIATDGSSFTLVAKEGGDVAVTASTQFPLTRTIASCRAKPNRFSAWIADPTEIVRAAMGAVEGPGCLRGVDLELALGACMHESASTTPSLEVEPVGSLRCKHGPEPWQDYPFILCHVSVSTMEHAGRRWVKLDFSEGHGSFITSYEYIVEMTTGSPHRYFFGQADGMSGCGVRDVYTRMPDEMARDWSTFPEHVRRFMCHEPAARITASAASAMLGFR